MQAEWQRLEETAARTAHWRRWGAYLSERQWGTVREDYSPYGTAWDYFPFEHSHLRTYRWGEDGLLGYSDNHCRVCFSVALWNGRDPILKERLFGLAGPLGSHGEDVKELYYYLDATPTASYMKGLYKYPQREFPYSLLREKGRRDRRLPEYELIDTGIFDDDRYFDVFIEYAKADARDTLIRVTAHNRGPEAAPLWMLGQVWFRNQWSFGRGSKPGMEAIAENRIRLHHEDLGHLEFWAESPDRLVFTENETNVIQLFGYPDQGGYFKDGFGRLLIQGQESAVNPQGRGTKGAGMYRVDIPAGGSHTFRFRLRESETDGHVLGSVDSVFERRIAEADEYYKELLGRGGRVNSGDAKHVQRQACAGLIWTKQYFGFSIEDWLKGDPGQPPPPPERKSARNAEWRHLFNEDIISMPDKWEYPWYAAWDSAFHMIPFALIDPEFAKKQLGLFLREWYMHPNGQIPAYEWAFGDVNPPVHAWAAWRVYKIEKKRKGVGDHVFLERVFHKLLLNFTWWVNRKDAEGKNIFQGGFLGLDNIGVFDRSAPLPTGGHIEQSDATSWMGMYCLNMLSIALELARDNRAYEDVASKFFEHFVYICRAMNNIGGEKIELWNRDDGFFYDVLHLPDGQTCPLKVRSLVGLIPLFAVETLDSELIDQLPRFKHRMQWFIENRPDFSIHVETQSQNGEVRRFLSLVNRSRLKSVLRYMLDEEEFLSPYGIRALSRYHKDHPYVLSLMGREYRVDYEPAESSTGLFGGNSNWRGPIWFPVNYLLIESLQKFHYFLGEEFKVEYPVRSGRFISLNEVASELSRRLTHIFLRDKTGRRPVYGGLRKFQNDPCWRDAIAFYEYFHGDNGTGIGASHQTGWTGLVAKLIQQSGE